MIAILKGTLLFKSPGHIIVEVNGIGYRVFIPLSTFYELSNEGTPVLLNIYTAVKEDAIHLFGFQTPEEKGLFEFLISVNGIGPKLAINILSGISTRELVRAISSGDVAKLVKIPGVGKKIADRMIVELQDRLLKSCLYEEKPEAGGLRPFHDALQEDALSALVNLGYKKATAKAALERIIEDSSDEKTLEQILKSVLKYLA
jgi:holliday junction DNA helicase RuvA